MTTAQKIHYLRQFEQLLNMIEKNNCVPIGIVSGHLTDDNLLGFSPMFIGNEPPLTIPEYGMLINRMGANMVLTKPEVTDTEPMNRNQNLN